MNGKAFDLTYTPDAVKDVLKRIDTFFSGYDIFIGDSQQAKCTYFKVLNYMLLSPFMATLRYTAEKNGLGLDNRYQLSCRQRARYQMSMSLIVRTH